MTPSRVSMAAIVLSLGAVSIAGASAVVIRVEGGEVGSALRLHAFSAAGEEWEATEAIPEDRQLSLPLDASAGWRVAPESDGFWAAPVEVVESPTVVRLWPAAEYDFQMVPPKATVAPSDVTIRFSRAESVVGSAADQPIEAEVRCRPERTGRVKCPGPAGTWDLRLKSAGYAASYLWDRRTTAGEKLDLGRILLVPGASVLGQVATEEGPADPELAQVTARPRAQHDVGGLGAPAGLEKKEVSVRVNPWGYYSFDALPAGAYEIAATQEGFEETSVPVELRAGEDIELRDPIVLVRPLHLIVQIRPAIDSGGVPWTVVLRAERPEGWTDLARRAASGEGEWRSPALPPGNYWISVESGDGNTMASARFDLQRGSEVQALEMDLLEVAGKLKLGDTDLAGDLWFGGRNGEVRVYAQADAEGEFSLVLPRSGSWKVDVHSETERVSATEVEVDVEQPRSGKAAEVEITLPNTELRGTVRDSRGAFVGGARIALVPLSVVGRGTFVESDGLGGYAIRGQAEGTYSIEASKGRASAERVQVQIDEELSPTELDLVLKEGKQLNGIVLAGGAPVGGAWVLGFPLTSGGSLAAMGAAQARTDMNGTFDLELPESAASVRVVSGMPGFTLSLSHVALADLGATVDLSLDLPSGQLELGRHAPGPTPDGRIGLVIADGEPIDLAVLDFWAKSQAPNPSTETLLVVGGMPAGAYSYCLLEVREALLVLGGSAYPKAEACTGGILAPNGTLRLGLP